VLQAVAILDSHVTSPRKDAYPRLLNAVRVLTRLLPILFEESDTEGAEYIDRIFWYEEVPAAPPAPAEAAPPGADSKKTKKRKAQASPTPGTEEGGTAADAAAAAAVAAAPADASDAPPLWEVVPDPDVEVRWARLPVWEVVPDPDVEVRWVHLCGRSCPTQTWR
jgi:hypothetical protein